MRSRTTSFIYPKAKWVELSPVKEDCKGFTTSLFEQFHELAGSGTGSRICT